MADDRMDRFSEACGLVGPLRVRVEGPTPGESSTFEFRRPFFLLGRGESADVPLDHPEVSPRHAYFQVVAGRMFCVDLLSEAGVRWDDGVRPVGWVDPERGVRIGPYHVRPGGVAEGQGGHLAISVSFNWPSLPDASLEALGANPGREPWQVSRALVLLGSSPTCRVLLSGRGVGKIHAALLRTPGGIWAVDLQGPGGLLVGGVAATCARLDDGDEIGVGDQRLRVSIGSTAFQAHARSELVKRPSKLEPSIAPKATDRPAGPATMGGAGPGRELVEATLVDAVTARLLEEFNRMHQRTTEQFQQAILMMFRMHQDQMDVVRDELSRIDRLEEELRSLRAELARGDAARPPGIALRLVSGEPATTPPAPSPFPRDPDPRDPAGPPASPPPTAGSPAPPIEISSIPEARHGRATPRLAPDVDLHARLAERIAQIQDERQGMWKRIIASLTGDPSKQSLP